MKELASHVHGLELPGRYLKGLWAKPNTIEIVLNPELNPDPPPPWDSGTNLAESVVPCNLRRSRLSACDAGLRDEASRRRYAAQPFFSGFLSTKNNPGQSGPTGTGQPEYRHIIMVFHALHRLSGKLPAEKCPRAVNQSAYWGVVCTGWTERWPVLPAAKRLKQAKRAARPPRIVTLPPSPTVAI